MLLHEHAQRLIARRIDPGLAQHMGLRSAPDGSAILFDYRIKGQLHNTKVRRGKGNMPWEATGRPLALWNLDSLAAPPAPDEAVIITEGEFDTLALLQCGFSRVVSVPNGAPTSPEDRGDKRFAYLYQEGTDELLPDLAKFGRYILAVDSDAKGQYLRDALAVRLGDDKCLWVAWPEGCKDANDALIAHGPENLQNMIWAAKRMWLDHVARLSDIPDQPPVEVYTLGQEMMDIAIETGGVRIPRVGFVTISGPAKHGKSTWGRQLCWHLWRTYGAPFAITSYEEDAKPTYQNEFRRLGLGKDPRKVSLDELGRIDIELESALVVIQRAPDGTVDVDQLLANVEFAIRVYGSRTILIDPANEVDRGDGPNQAEATGKMIMALKQMATKYRVLVIVIAHPPADIVRKKRKEDFWTLYDVEGSRHWAGKSDHGFMLWRLENDTMLYAAAPKRIQEFGRKALFAMSHDWDQNRLTAYAVGDHLLTQRDTDRAMGHKATNGQGGGTVYSAQR